MPHECQEALYIPMLDGYMDGVKLHPFCVFAATTHPHMLLGPLKSRLMNKWYFDRYEQHTILHMIVKFWRDKNLDYTIEAANMVAVRALGILEMRIIWQGK